MKKDEFNAEFNKYISRFSIELSNEAYNQIELYFYLLMEEQQRMNLTAYKTVGDFVRYHLIDTLRVHSNMKIHTELKNSSDMRLLDVGSGAGVPGLIMAVLEQWSGVTLVESTQKKAGFLKRCVDMMNLHAVEVIAERSESLAHHEEQREQYDIVIARGLASLPQALELTTPFLKIGGQVYLPKGSNEPPDVSSNLLRTLGIEHENTLDYLLPEREDLFRLFIFKKTSPTQKKYPRKPGQIRKNPL